MEDTELLRHYAHSRVEEAFAELVRRHVDLVYSAALRQTGGQVLAAQDVTQAVFIELARQAGKLTRHPALSGWLYTTARHISGRLVRDEQRRFRREQEACAMGKLLHDGEPELDWGRIGPVLDEAMHELHEADRRALLLRFFEGRDFRAVGAALALTESGARMRVERALDKLRNKLVKRGLTSTSSALAAILATQAVAAAPPNLAAGVTAGSLLAIKGTSTAATILSSMASTKIKTGFACLLIVCAGSSIVVLQFSNEKLQVENVNLRQTTADTQHVREENARLGPTKTARDELARLRADHQELLRLRERRENLREQIERRRVDQEQLKLKDSVVEIELVHRMLAGIWGHALIRYAWTNEYQLPKHLHDAVPLLNDDEQGVRSEAAALGIDDEQFEIVYHGRLEENRLSEKSSKRIILREKQPFIDEKGRLARTYVLRSGLAQIHYAEEGSFEDFEREHGLTQ